MKHRFVSKYKPGLLSRLQCSGLIFAVAFAFSLSSQEGRFLLDNGERIDLDGVSNQWVVISYWASWCGPCREEIRILNEIHRERSRFNVIVLGVNFDGVQGEELASQKARFGAEFPDLLEDPRARWDEQRPEFIPHTMVVNPQGELSAVIVGSTTRREILEKITD